MNFIARRLRRLEGSARGGPCHECYQKPESILVYYPDKGELVPEPARCSECDRPLQFLVRVVFDDPFDDPGEGHKL
jgi:hypothetical protein